MQMVIKIPDVPIEDYQDLFNKIYGMAASEGLFDDKVKSQRALALKAVLDILGGITNGIPLPKGHGDLKDANNLKHAFISWSMAVQGFFTDADIASIIYNSTTIIGADNGE